MSGNVREWVSDWYRADYYKVGPKKDPPGPAEHEATLIEGKPCRVARGGDWSYTPRLLRTAVRTRCEPTTRMYHIGFRCALSFSDLQAWKTGREALKPTDGLKVEPGSATARLPGIPGSMPKR